MSSSCKGTRYACYPSYFLLAVAAKLYSSNAGDVPSKCGLARHAVSTSMDAQLYVKSGAPEPVLEIVEHGVAPAIAQ